MKKWIGAIALLVLSLPICSYAGLYGNLSLMSNYIWRGVSQTNNGPAVEGDLGFEHKGFYVGMTGENVDYGPEDPAYLELAPYVGFEHEFESHIKFDLSCLYYVYPHTTYDYSELSGSVGYRIFSLGLQYAMDYFNEKLSDLYPYVAVKFELPKGFEVGGHVGYSSKARNEVDEEGSFWDYEMYASHELFSGLNAKFIYTNTVERHVEDKLGGNKFVLVVYKELA